MGMESLAEEFRKRQDAKPDQWTLAWWKDQFADQAKATRGATHAMNLVLAEIEDRDANMKKLQKQVNEQAQELHEAKPTIGRLQADVTELKEAMGKAREAYAELKKKIGT